MSEQTSRVAQLSVAFLIGVAATAGWTGSSFVDSPNSQGETKKSPGTGTGTSTGQAAPAGGAESGSDRTTLKRRVEAPGGGDPNAERTQIPPGPRTGEFFLPSRYFAVGSHDLGVIDRGVTVTIEVESTTSGMDLIAVVDEPDVTVSQGRFFSDDDSANGFDPAVRFVAPVTGNYVLRIRDLDQRGGFYRYRVAVF